MLSKKNEYCNFDNCIRSLTASIAVWQQKSIQHIWFKVPAKFSVTAYVDILNKLFEVKLSLSLYIYIYIRILITFMLKNHYFYLAQNGFVSLASDDPAFSLLYRNLKNSPVNADAIIGGIQREVS